MIINLDGKKKIVNLDKERKVVKLNINYVFRRNSLKEAEASK